MRLIGGRVFWTVVQFTLIIFAVLTLLFFLQRLSGDPAAVLVGHNASPEVLAAIHVEMGLDKPLWQQYAIFVGKAIRLDFGESIRYQTSALDMVMHRLPNSLLLSFSALTLAVVVALPLGIYAALRHSELDGKAINLFAGVLQAVPSFWLGLLLLLVFSVHLRWVGSVAHLEDNVFRRLALPTITLASFYVARLIRMMRSSMLETLNQPYVVTAHAKGLSPRRVLVVHALKNALLPIVAVITLDLSLMIGGSIIVETLFSYSGIGNQLVKAVFNRDYALVQASVFVIAMLVVCINMTANALYGFIDPRVREVITR